MVLPCFLSLLLATAVAVQEPPLLRGDYLEDRANRVFGCYYEWSGEGEYGGREAMMAWRVTPVAMSTSPSPA
jgi:hypothetical protein